ncbi:non-ribosomal peptide synthetase, partial [Paractinoplanes brasiliensis]
IVVRDLFQASTVAKLAAVIGDARGARPALAAGRRPERVPLSSAQQRLWFLHRMEGPTPTYNLASALRLTGELDLAALEAAFGDVVNRHESLRTVFADDADGSHQIVLDDVRPPFSVAPATDLDDDLRAAARHSFDLSREIPIRMSVFRTGPDEWVALLLMHHIASDGWSMPVLADDLTSAYGARRAGREPDWEPLPVQYADFALWQRGLLEGEQEGQLAYWRRALAGLPEEISLPTDRPRPARGTQAGQVVRFDLPASLHAGLLDVAARTGTTAFMVVQAALAVVLSRLGAGTDIPIGTPIAGRADTALDKLVGFFVNTLVLRCDLTGDPTFTELLGRIREVDLDAYAHQDVPFERLVEELNPARSLARHPLFQTELLWQQQEPGRTAPGDLGGLRVADRPVHTGVARFDLSFALFAGADAGPVHGELLFSTDLFDRSTAESLVVRLTQALTAVAGEPDRRISRIELLTDQERRWLLTEWNDTGREVTTATLPALFEAQVARAPHAPAVSFGEVTWTYEELNARANQLARALIEHGVGPEDFVAVVLPRSPELVAGLMAVLKAGAAYFPVDPNLPPARVAYMLENVSPAAVLTTDLGGLSLPAGPGARIDVRGELTRPATDVRDDERTSRLSPLHPSYVIHTSGSTGRPKGVVMTTGAMVNVLEWHNRSVPGGPGTVTAQFAAVSFDVSVQEMLSALLYGKSLVACPEEIRRDPRELAAWMARHRVQELLSPNLVVDAVFEAAQEYGEDLSALGLVAQAGEALTLREHVRRFYSRWPGNQLHNQYGPTETQVVTAWPLPSDVADWPAVPPIGGPVDNTRLYVLDEGLMPVPVGVTGELYIAGAGLARGYHNRPGLTAERFVADPFDGRGARMYRSGDLVRHRPDGLLDFVGRADHQVKLRGFRIELGEIEQVLGGHPSVVRAAVLLTDDKRLVAYVVPAGGAEFGVDELRAHAQSALPDYMMPSVIVPIDSLPFTVNGKLDRRALPDVTAEPSRAGRRAPHGAREEILCGLFAEVLKVQDVGVDDNFFELGGHSMLVASLIRRVKAVLGLDLAVRTLFESPTVAELVEALATTRPDDPGAALRTMLPLRARGELTPLFCVHAGSGASWCYSGLMAQLDPQQPIYGLQARGIAEVEPLPSTVEEMAADYLAEIRKVQPHGPYRLLGWSFGGHAAHAIATLLQEQGEEVDLLVLVDSHPQGKESPRLSTSEIVAQQMRAVGFPFEEEELVEGAFPMERYLAHLRTYNNAFADLTDDQIVRMLDIYVNNVQLMRAFEPGLYRGDVLFFSAAPGGVKVADSARWQPYVRGLIDDHDIDSDHEGMFTRPEAVAAIGAILAKALAP